MASSRTLLLAFLAAGISTASAKIEIVQVFQVAANPPPELKASDAKASPAPAAAPKKPPVVQVMKQSRALRIEIRNGARTPEGPLNIRYWVFGFDVGSRKKTLLGGGEETKSLKPNETIIVEGKTISSTFQQPMVVVPGGKAEPPPPPSGQKNIGHGVQVLKDGKVIASSFSEEGLRSLVGAEGDKPGTAVEQQVAPTP